MEDKSGRLWFGTEGGGVAMLDTIPPDLSKIEFTVFDHQDGSDLLLSGGHIRSNIVEDGEGNLYLGTYANGISIICAGLDSVRYLRHDPENKNTLADDNIYGLFIDSKNRLWIGTQKEGLDLYFIEDHKFVHYPSTKDQNTLNHGEIETIAEDFYENIWVGSDNGLSLMVDPSTRIPQNNFVNFLHEPQDDESLLSNSIKKIYVDSRNTVWIASYYGGINVFGVNNFKFVPIRHKTWIKSSLPHNNVSAFEEDEYGNLWIGTDGGGLACLKNGINDLYQDNYQRIELINPFTQEPQFKIKSLRMDQNKNLWIGTWASGVFKYNTKDQSYVYFGADDPKSPFKAFSALCLTVDADNSVWIGTLTDGLGYYNGDLDEFKVYTAEENNRHNFKSNRINAVLADSRNKIWVGGEVGGLNLYDRESDTFETILVGDLLTEKITIVTLAESKNGSILIGTLSGLFIYDHDTRRVVKVGLENGLPDEAIHGILEDDSGFFWLTTNKGISVFNKIENSVVSFNIFDGLQSNQFNHNSVFKSRGGAMFFGGIYGWNGFNPQEIIKSDRSYPIVFTKFYLNGIEQTRNDEGYSYLAQLNSRKSLLLKSKEKNIGFEIAHLEYNFSNQNQYAYMLEGFNMDWQEMGSDRKIFFTNLYPGEYALRIKATNKNGFWHEMTNPLVIEIQPALWQTTWFTSIMIILLVLLIFWIIHIRTKYLIKQNEKLEKQVAIRTTELKESNTKLSEKNNEVLAQNEELSAQNDQILLQREELESAHEKLHIINQDLEKIVEKRTRHLRSTIKKLDKTVQELDRFIYSASHDLSAPMKSIRGLIDIALNEKKRDDIIACLYHIKLSSNRFEAVISNLVSYSTNAHTKVKSTTIDLYDKVEDIFVELKHWPEATNFSFINQIPPNTKLTTDENRLDMILRNLISNSLKYADSKKGNSFVKVEGNKKRSIVTLKVSDNGIGIKQESLDKIFDMFFRGSEKSFGSGLGLYIVNESVQKLKGSITVKSTPSKGSTFVVEIPLVIKK
jgi:signal transduction histidine kinase/ligand-binding sensor domain-containing protein